MRSKIWDLVAELLREEDVKKLVLFEGVKKYEDQVKDIVDSIEDLALEIESKLGGE